VVSPIADVRPLPAAVAVTVAVSRNPRFVL
jgi:hypothetical protein